MAAYALIREAGTLFLVLGSHPDAGTTLCIDDDNDLEALRARAQESLDDDPTDLHYPGGLVDLVARKHQLVGRDLPCTACEGEHERRCSVCDGGLAICAVCAGAEGSLPTHCPGAAIDGLTASLIYRAGLDFYQGHWTFSDGPLARGTFAMLGQPGSIDRLVEYADTRLARAAT